MSPDSNRLRLRQVRVDARSAISKHFGHLRASAENAGAVYRNTAHLRQRSGRPIAVSVTRRIDLRAPTVPSPRPLRNPGLVARKTLTQRRPLRNPGVVARKTPHRFRPKTAESFDKLRTGSASPFGEGEEPGASTQLLTDFGRRRPNPSAGSGQVLPLSQERGKNGVSSKGLTPRTFRRRRRRPFLEAKQEATPLGRVGCAKVSPKAAR